MKRIAPGVYDDGQGGMHLDLAELLEAHGYADTPANRAMMLAVTRDAFGAAAVKETTAPIEVDDD